MTSFCPAAVQHVAKCCRSPSLLHFVANLQPVFLLQNHNTRTIAVTNSPNSTTGYKLSPTSITIQQYNRVQQYVIAKGDCDRFERTCRAWLWNGMLGWQKCMLKTAPLSPVAISDLGCGDHHQGDDACKAWTWTIAQINTGT